MSDPPAEVRTPRWVIIDASSFVRAALTPRSAARRLLNVALARSALVVSAPVLDEVAAVLARPKFERWLTEADRLEFVRQVRGGAAVFRSDDVVNACRDPSDDKYLEAALAAAAAEAGGPEAVVVASDDRDLLVLNPWQGVAILKPEAVLALFGEA